MTANIDFKLISSDDHIIESPDVWKGRLESKFQDDRPLLGSTHRHHIGVDNLMFEVDCPHSDTSFPKSRELEKERFDGVPKGEIR